MTRFEYKVVPAPTSGLKAKSVKTSEARFANALQTLMNELGAEGWEYVRADTLPCEERSGLTGRVTKYQNMLVFRRPLAAAEVRAPLAGLLEAPTATADDNRTPAHSADTRAPAHSADTRAPAHSADAHGADEPPLQRPARSPDAVMEGEPERGDTSAAARAAAAAFRNVRGAEPRLTRQDAATPGQGPGVAAE